VKHLLPEDSNLWSWVRYFLELHLPQHLGFSKNTQASYRIAFRRLLQFLIQERGRRWARKARIKSLDSAALLDFLSWLESSKGKEVSPQTRNCRLAALRSFFRFLELHRPEDEIVHWRRLRQLPFKRTKRPATEHFEFFEVEKIFATVPIGARDGFRDLTLLAVLYNTGARAEEIAGIRKAGLLLDELPSVRLLGKGNRERICPLWPTTAQLLRHYLDCHRRPPRSGSEPFVFINQRGAHLTRFGVGRLVGKYIDHAATTLPSLQSKQLSTHSFRHTTAIHLLESGADINVVKAWLGHRSVQTTGRYLDLNLENHRKTLAIVPVPLALRHWQEGQANPQESSEESSDATSDWLDQL